MMDDALTLAVRRAQQGDARAFDALVRRFQAMAVAYARTLLPDPAAEDAAQEAFVQAWRDLPRLNEPAAFGAWLRRLVFKFCDRARRSARPVLPLDESLPLPDEQGPVATVERADEAARVRAAVEVLPGPMREATLLYYLTGHDLKEIASFLGVPTTTVKSRLHAARKRLREELWSMSETTLKDLPWDRPAPGEAFTESVLTRVLREFQRQEAADPHTADRGLLETGRSALFGDLEQGGALDEEALRDGFGLLWRKRDWAGLSALLMRALAQPLSDSRAASAYLHLANAVAMGGSPAGAVLAHEAFERWLPGRSPRLSARWPYPPTPGDAPDAYGPDEVRLLFLSQSAEFTTSYAAVFRRGDYLAKVDAARAAVPVTPFNRMLHFYALRMAANSSKDLDVAERYVDQMDALAAGAEDEATRENLAAKAIVHRMRVATLRRDQEGWAALAAKAASVLDRAAAREGSGTGWVRAERHDLACQLVGAGRHEQALPLWEENAATGGQFGGWGWLLYAATVWRLTCDRDRVLALLREARAHDDRDMAPMFTGCPEFEDVSEDRAFLEAIGRR